MHVNEDQGTGSALRGFLWLLGLHILGQFVISLGFSVWSSELFLVMWSIMGVSQVVYVLPACIWFYKRGLPAHSKGVLIGAAITFMLNAACFGIGFHMFMTNPH